MEIKTTPIPGLLVVKPKVFKDERGFFMESFRADKMADYGVTAPFIQDNRARSVQKGVLRGLHFQRPPHSQAKLVSVTRGAVFDVAVDLRSSSPTFGRWLGLVLSADNFAQLYVPRGFAHAYLTLEDECEVEYKVDAYYAPQADAGVLWNDPDIGVDWPMKPTLISAKDMALPGLKELDNPF